MFTSSPVLWALPNAYVRLWTSSSFTAVDVRRGHASCTLRQAMWGECAAVLGKDIAPVRASQADLHITGICMERAASTAKEGTEGRAVGV